MSILGNTNERAEEIAALIFSMDKMANELRSLSHRHDVVANKIENATVTKITLTITARHERRTTDRSILIDNKDMIDVILEAYIKESLEVMERLIKEIKESAENIK